MTRAFLFWLLMLIWLVFGLWRAWPVGLAFGGDLLLFLLLGLLGWSTFGRPIQ